MYHDDKLSLTPNLTNVICQATFTFFFSDCDCIFKMDYMAVHGNILTVRFSKGKGCL